MARSKKAKKSLRSRRFTDEQRTLALTLVQSGMTLGSVAKKLGTTEASISNWRKAAEKNGTMPVVPTKGSELRKGKGKSAKVAGRGASQLSTKSPYAPAAPAQGLSNQEVAAILECKTEHLSMGPAQSRTQLKRFKGWRISLKAIKRVLKQHGYEFVYRGSRPQGEVIQRFEAPRRNALWQADFAEVRVGPEKLYVLIMLDDFSRYVVGCALCSSPSSSVVVETFHAAISRHGKRGRPTRLPDQSSELDLLRALLASATTLLRQVNLGRPALRALVVGAWLRLRAELPQLTQERFCETLALPTRTLRSWLQNAPSHALPEHFRY